MLLSSRNDNCEQLAKNRADNTLEVRVGLLFMSPPISLSMLLILLYTAVYRGCINKLLHFMAITAQTKRRLGVECKRMVKWAYSRGDQLIRCLLVGMTVG